MSRALAASLAAGSAYLASMWADSKLSSHPFNDLKLVGQVFTTKAPAWVIMGVGGHYSFSALMALLYAHSAYPRLPGPGWLRGLLFLQLENMLLYPGAALVEPHHAGIRSGQVPTLLSRKSFAGQVLRHVAFGLVLGLVYRPKG